MNLLDETINTLLALFVLAAVYYNSKNRKNIAILLFAIAIITWLIVHTNRYTTLFSFTIETLLFALFIFIAVLIVDKRSFTGKK